MRPVVIRITEGTLAALAERDWWQGESTATWQMLTFRDAVQQATVLRDGGVQILATPDALDILTDMLFVLDPYDRNLMVQRIDRAWANIKKERPA